MTQEQCARCGDGPDDLRTLWMACLYAMNELAVPLTECEIQGGRYASAGGSRVYTLTGSRHPTFERSERDPSDRRFYTLRVCKDCRAEWMQAIEDWFRKSPHRDDCGSGFYTRRLGATVEVPPDDLMRDPE